MKKVLILSYFFPPCNLTASQRAYGWAKYLNKFGYYPVVITRSWDIPVATPEDGFLKSGKHVVIKKEEGYEVHYLPYHPSLRDKLFTHPQKNSFLLLIQKALSFIELLSYGITSFLIPYNNIYTYSKNYLLANADTKKMIVIANPFLMFKFGYLLNKELGIKWIADYRDDWNTNELRKKTASFSLSAIIRWAEKKNELKWVNAASLVTSVSGFYASKISRFTGKKSNVLFNGYINETVKVLEENALYTNCFLIVYNGTLYDSQPVELVLESFEQFVAQHLHSKIKFIFIGTAFDAEQKQRIVKKAIELKIDSYIEITDRKPRAEVLQIQSLAHVLMMISYVGKKGIPSSKLYEYLSVGKPVVSFPCDEDIIDDTLKPYNLGYVCATKQQLTNTFNDLYKIYEENKYHELIADRSYMEFFSREHQAEKLAALLDGI